MANSKTQSFRLRQTKSTKTEKSQPKNQNNLKIKTKSNQILDLPVDLLENEATGSKFHYFLKEASLPCTTQVETDIFRNRDPKLFQRIVQFLETNHLPDFGVEEYKNLIEEARFYELPDLENFLKTQVFRSFSMERPLTRRDKRRPESGRQRYRE